VKRTTQKLTLSFKIKFRKLQTEQMTRSTKDHWCAENRPCRTQWLRQYVTQHHPCLQLFILLAIWADLLQLSASSNELVFHPLHFSLIQKELNKNTCKRRWEFSPKHSGFLMAFTDVKMRRKTLELCRKYWNCLYLSSTIFLWSNWCMRRSNGFLLLWMSFSHVPQELFSVGLFSSTIFCS